MSYSNRPNRGYHASPKGRRNYGGNNRRRSSNKSRGSYIDPSRFIKAAAEVSYETEYRPDNTFTDFNLHELLHRNLQAKGFENPSPIQDQAIPVALKGQDVVGIASTGTGKTAAFALPMLHKLMHDQSSAALIIAPTRELAQQIEKECKDIARGSGLFGALLIGGSSMGLQLRDLRENPRIVIGTPGRIKDHIERRTLKLEKFNIVVLDEVDRMLDMGFVDDVRTIISNTHNERQSLFFSATMDAKVQSLITTFTNNPVTISLKPSNSSENVHQDVVRFGATHEKLDKLHDILLGEEVSKAIIFDETRRNVERLHKELVARGFSAGAIHGGKTQGQRQRSLEQFKQSKVDILVATDVAARGLDVSDITHVVNYTVPKEFDDYVHRVGRAGRAGQIGYAYTFVSA